MGTTLNVAHMPITIRLVGEAEAGAASAVVQASFLALAAKDWDGSAQQVFLAESSAEALVERLRVAAYAAGAFEGQQMVGFLLMPNEALLGMLFVDPKWVRQGVGRALWERAREHVEAQFPAIKTVELNATPNALPFYRSIGFVPISEEFTRAGCRTTRMACWLPARALGAECAPTSPSSG